MIRAATVEDAAAIARVQHNSWLHAYADYVDPELMIAVPLEQREEETRASIVDAGIGTWVWHQGDKVAGFVVVGRARDDDADADTGELYAIYVDPHAQGAGLGTALLSRAVDDLRERGFRSATLWTFVANGLARRFYELHGWTVEPDSSAFSPLAWAPAVRYRRAL